MRYICLFFVLLMLSVGAHSADEETQEDEQESEVVVETSVESGNKAHLVSSAIRSNVEITGYAIINNELWIDGVKIQRPQSVYVSRKNGKKYRIRWGKDGEVNVSEE